MEEVKETVDEERQATLQMWDYAFSFTPTVVLKCAIHLQIADHLVAHGGAITHSELSAAIGGSSVLWYEHLSVLHNWSDEECVQILIKKCWESTRKLIITEAVIREGVEDVQMEMALDMAILVHTERGKERSVEDWECVVREDGFTRFAVKHIQAIVSVIEAYP